MSSAAVAASASAIRAKPKVTVDVVSDTVCPWCCVGKKNLDRAIAAYASARGDADAAADVEVTWHAYQLNPAAPREGQPKEALYRSLFGDRVPAMTARMTQVFADLGLSYSLGGLTGNTLDSHRLLAYARSKGAAVQNAVVEELFLDYFTREKYIGDREVLVAAAERVGLTGAREFLEDPKAGLSEVESDLKRFRGRVNGVPHFMIGDQQFSGAQPPEVLAAALKAAAATAASQ